MIFAVVQVRLEVLSLFKYFLHLLKTYVDLFNELQKLLVCLIQMIEKSST